MTTFAEFLSKFSWDEIARQIYSCTAADVERALSAPAPRRFEDFCALISPAGEPLVEAMLKLSREATLRRFGRTIQMYIPLYLSNECHNVCTYCGFSNGNKIPRITLNEAQIIAEAEAIKALGYDHVLLVTGEWPSHVGISYFEHAVKILRPYFSQISIEVQPLHEDEYRRLHDIGVYAVLVYQETYHRERYVEHHLKGKKRDYEWRLDTPERLGRAGIHKIGLGALIGLDDWRVDSAHVALHLAWLEKKFWRTKYSISFPRLRPAEGLIEPKIAMSDGELLQLIAAYRLFNENVELSLSTRECASFRDRAITAGITSVSAGSRTEPGGYAIDSQALKQFEISDERTPHEVAEMIRLRGYEPVWKDWEAVW